MHRPPSSRLRRSWTASGKAADHPIASPSPSPVRKPERVTRSLNCRTLDAVNPDHTTSSAGSPSHSFAQRLELWISSGVWPNGTTLPSLDELGRIFRDQNLLGIQEVLNGFLSRGVLLLDSGTGRLQARGPFSARGENAEYADLGRPFDNAEDRVHALREACNALLCQSVRRLAAHATHDDLDHLEFALARAVNDQSAENLAAFDRELVLRAGNGLMLRIYDRLISLGMAESSATLYDSPDATLARTEILTAITAQEHAAAVRFTEGLLISPHHAA